MVNKIEHINDYHRVLASNTNFFLAFMTDWDTSCKSQLYEFVDFSKIDDTRIVIINIDEFKDLKEQYNITTHPTTKFVKGGKVAETNVGLVTKEKLLEMVK